MERGRRGKAIVHLRQGREWQVEAEFLHSVNGLAEGAGEVPAAHFSEGQSQREPGIVHGAQYGCRGGQPGLVG